MSDLAIEVHGLTKRFGERAALTNVDLSVPRRSVFGFLGPNGAGKTTLIRLLLGLSQPTGGSMQLLGSPLPEERESVLGRVGAIVEEPQFHRYLTARENLAITAAARGPEAHERIDAVLARVGLAERADDRVKTYSLGMRQRLGVARALLADPELLILDEPTNGLDPAGIHEFRQMVREFVDGGMTVLLSSHLLDEVEKVADYVAIVDRGSVVLQGSIADLHAGSVQSILVSTNDESQAMAVLVLDAVVCAAERTEEGIRVTLRPGLDADAVTGEITRRLVEAGLEIRRIEPVRASLEQRFLEITTRLGVTQ
jgi:ABC-2 type transport system ATP-binding protein